MIPSDPSEESILESHVKESQISASEIIQNQTDDKSQVDNFPTFSEMMEPAQARLPENEDFSGPVC